LGHDAPRVPRAWRGPCARSASARPKVKRCRRPKPRPPIRCDQYQAPPVEKNWRRFGLPAPLTRAGLGDREGALGAPMARGGGEPDASCKLSPRERKSPATGEWSGTGSSTSGANRVAACGRR
jgi:hypothetical protein